MSTANDSEIEVIAAELLAHIEKNTCFHLNTHRGGVLWEICDDCGAQWADDEGGKPKFKAPDCVKKAKAYFKKHKAP